jgi:hypothetical protein|tara:strand:- start:230 stop:496 length:267 start_codon:yes stop_codon:yes gene_type:complete
MTDLELSIKALQAGILPAFTGDEVAKLLETCDPEEAYRLKRKFRKLWRKELKLSLRKASSNVEVRRTVTLFSTPSQRRSAVRRKLEKQ